MYYPYTAGVAALVKVTVKMLSTGICSSTTKRVNKAAMPYVLPVPAEASIRLVPAMGMLRGSNAGMEALAGMIKGGKYGQKA